MNFKLLTPLLLGLAFADYHAVAQTNVITPESSNEAVIRPAQTNAAASEASSDAVSAPSGDAASEAPAQPSAIIPLIVMDEVQLTDAIRNLARQAGLNYMLDPRVNLSQPGPDGKSTGAGQPLVSVRWENVTAEQALNALLNNYNLQIVEDLKSKIARITIKDPAAPEPLMTKVYQLSYASPTNVALSVQTILVDKARSKVVPDVRTSQLVVLATEKEIGEVDKLVDRLDTQTKQVLIEARLVETSMNPKTAKGIDWSGTLKAQHVSYGNGVAIGKSTTSIPGTPTTRTLPSGRSITTTPSSSTTTVLDSVLGNGGLSMNTLSGLSPNIGFLNADGVHAVISFLNENSDARVLSEPRTVTLDNEPAVLSVTRATPIINVTPGTANTTGGSQILYTNLGVILHVTPRISANSYVNLKVAPEVSRLFDTVTKTVNGQTSQADEYDFRKIETHVMIPSGNTLVLGGLMQDDITTSGTKVPGLGDIPGLGVLFRSNAKSRQKSNLIIFITPTIVQETDFQPSTSTFLKTPPTDNLGPDWSAWDTTAPYKFNSSAAHPASTGASGSSSTSLSSQKSTNH